MVGLPVDQVVVSIGPVTSRAISELGVLDVVEAEPQTSEGMVRALVEHGHELTAVEGEDIGVVEGHDRRGATGVLEQGDLAHDLQFRGEVFACAGFEAVDFFTDAFGQQGLGQGF